MSLRTYFLRSEFNLWRGRVREAWSNIRFQWAMRPLKARVREFARKYLFWGVFARWHREKQATANSNRWLAEVKRRQNLCSHLKGQRYFNMTGAPRPSALEDYNVSFHRFINNRARIICNKCRRVWWEGDPDWKQALYMVKNSTNKASSSEIPSNSFKRRIFMEKKRRLEYKVITLDANPIWAENSLNELAQDRWHVVGTYFENRVILEREKA
jgi:hypothetical protein